MMEKKWIPIDVSYQDVVEDRHDLAIFACGYEKRSTFFASHILSDCSSEKLVFGFKESKDNPIYCENYSFYIQKGIFPVEIGYKDTRSLVRALVQAIEKFANDESTKSILVDYSSMPRSWFSEILNIIKAFSDKTDFVVDLVYSVGSHEQSISNRQLGEPSVLPGCEAVSVLNKRTVAVFGLGFDGGAPACLYDKVEPDKTFGLVADPGGVQDYAERAIRENSFFIRNHVDGVAKASLFSVQQCHNVLREILLPYQHDSAIVLIPFGPKPHALALIIKAMNDPHSVCLYASTGISNNSVYATGDYVLTRLFLERQEAMSGAPS